MVTFHIICGARTLELATTMLWRMRYMYFYLWP
ncbi:hypothetical protein PMIN01_04662 [Paraphaeosphaeria minitans]|uniref:Uncharacterized protein n=1 Tax=Paraphaeosphaeria minitans TaxID=565426 RepID=A0A9P6KRI7_9PLEO|nr:hypothetical protein PMIN01_04662 [Paraphaeosphaeria minitans]